MVGNLVAAVHRIERWEPTRSTRARLRTGRGRRSSRGGTDRGRPAAGRYSFVGPVDPELERRYVGKSVAAYLGTGTPSPITYVWCGPHWVNTPP